MNIMVTVAASTWAVSGLPVSVLAVNRIGVAMTCKSSGSMNAGVSPKAVNYLACC